MQSRVMKGAKRTAVTARETAGGEEEKKKKGKKVAVEAITIQMGAMSQTMETRKPWDAAGEEEEAVAAVHEVKILYTHKLMLCAARVCVEALPFTRVPLCRLLTCIACARTCRPHRAQGDWINTGHLVRRWQHQ